MSKMMKFTFKLLTVCSLINLEGAIGCQKFTHTVDEWDVAEPVYQACACKCLKATPHQGYCAECGHFGNPDRGAITQRVAADFLAKDWASF